MTVREVDAQLEAQIVTTNLATVSEHIRNRAAREGLEPWRRRRLRIALVELERVRRNLETAL